MKKQLKGNSLGKIILFTANTEWTKFKGLAKYH